MKILYIGHYKEGGGWSQTAIDHILAMDQYGMDVVCRNVKLTDKQPQIPSRILDLEKKSTDDCDVCIQHVLPHHLVGTDNFKKNIAYVELESASIESTSWFDSLSLVDEVWVPNQDIAESLLIAGFNKHVSTLRHTHNIDQYTTQYAPLNIPNIDNDFIFYFIGDFNDRKNIRSILRAFHSQFDVSEPVSLILKTHKFGKTEQEVKQLVDQLIVEVKTDLRMYPDLSRYKKDIVITGEIPSDKVMSLHQACDCFVCPSHGEAWSIPAFDAMAFGNTPICSNFGGPKEFIDKSNPHTGRLINGVYSICDSKDSAFPHLFTGREYWFEPCERELSMQMRSCFEEYKDKKSDLSKKRAGLSRAMEFSYANFYDNVGRLLGE